MICIEHSPNGVANTGEHTIVGSHLNVELIKKW